MGEFSDKLYGTYTCNSYNANKINTTHALKKQFS